MKYGRNWNETDPFAEWLVRDVFSSALPTLVEPGALPGPVRLLPQVNPGFPREEPVGEPSAEPVVEAVAEPVVEPSPAGSSLGKGSPGPDSPSRAVYRLDPAYIVQGRVDAPALNRDETFASAVARRLGLDGLDAFGTCSLPGHTGTGRVTRSKDKRFVYLCGCTSDDGYRSLTDTYASTISGRVAPPPKAKNGEREKLHEETTLVLWTRRLLAELGAIVPDQPDLLPLPADADEATAVVHEGLRLLLGLRAGTDLPEDFIFARRFVADWCGLSMDAARAGIEALREAGIIRQVGKIPVGGRATNLYRVGNGS